MQELLTNQWFISIVLLLNAIVAGQVMWFAINIKQSKMLQIIVFTIGGTLAICIGGIFKSPAFLLAPEAQLFDFHQLGPLWLFINVFIGLFIISSFVKNTKVSDALSYTAIIIALIGDYLVWTGIQEFGMRYMPTILFFTICIYSAVGLVIYQIKVATNEKMKNRLPYVFAGVLFAVICMNAFNTYQLVRETSYDAVSEGWE
jgi:hypothetical protein